MTPQEVLIQQQLAYEAVSATARAAANAASVAKQQKEEEEEEESEGSEPVAKRKKKQILSIREMVRLKSSIVLPCVTLLSGSRGCFQGQQGR